jgi:hypothetical protein
MARFLGPFGCPLVDYRRSVLRASTVRSPPERAKNEESVSSQHITTHKIRHDDFLCSITMPIPSFSPAPIIEARSKTSEAMHIVKKSPFVFLDEKENESPSLDDIILPELRLKTTHKQAEDSGELAPEPLLTENPHRFVLFPIQDSEVSALVAEAVCRPSACRRSSFLSTNFFFFFLLFPSQSYGACTSKRKPPSGPPKRLIWPTTSRIGSNG